MDMTDYTFEIVVRARLAELQADAERGNGFEAGRLGSRQLRGAVGRAFMRMGTRLFGVRKDSLSEVWP
jgi:hypothetical protein